jgi:hypothetical protein
MPSLNQYAQQLADSLNRPYDPMLLERIKDLIVQERATYLQQTMDKDGIDKEYRQTYYATLELIYANEITPQANPQELTITNKQIYKTTNKIPKPIRWKNYTPFMYVGVEGGNFPYRMGNYYTKSVSKYLPLIGETIMYDYIDGYVYVFPNYEKNGDVIPLSTSLRIDEVIQNPRFIRTGSNGGAGNSTREDCIYYTDDMEFAIPLDMINSLKLNLKELFIVDHKDILEKTHIDNN